MPDEKMEAPKSKGKMGIILSFVLLGLMIIAILWLIATDIIAKKNADSGSGISEIIANTNKPSVRVVEKVVEKEVEKFVEVEKKVSSEMIKEGLKDMGELITAEYYFTQVEDYTSVKKFFKIISSESNVVFSYDGVVTAGIDCSQIEINKNDETKQIKVILPKSDICQIDIDFDSFKLYSEKEAVWNQMKFSDYNLSMVEFENEAKNKALEKGILERADERAESLVVNFIRGIIDDNEYSIECEWR